MRYYETVFILTPVLSESQLTEAIEKFKGVLQNAGSDVYHEENWGLRKLAYAIQRKKTGYYVLFEYKAEPEAIASLDTEFRRDERVMRFLTVSMDKHALAYAEKRRKGHFKKKKEETSETQDAKS